MGISYNSSIVSSGLVLCLDAGNPKSYSGSGSTWTDLSQRGNTATLVNGPTYSNSNGGSIVFDGSNDYGTCTGGASNPLNVTSYTKSVWFKLSSLATNNNLVSANPGHFMYFAGGNKLYCGHSDWGNYAAYPSTTTFSIGIWYNVCLTFNTTDGMVLYVNGLRDSTYTALKTQAAGSGIEIASFAAGNFLTGSIAQIQVYNRSITETEVQQNFNALRGRFGI